jgi:KUP system potassium uptake protein
MQTLIVRDSRLQDNGLESISTDSSIEVTQEILCIRRPGVHVSSSPSSNLETQDELTFLMEGRDAGVTYLIENSVVKARRDASWIKKLAIDYVYSFLCRTCRERSVALHIPHESLLQVGMFYFVWVFLNKWR